MDNEFNIHNIRFYDFEPKAIHCIEYNNKYKLLALSRSDNTLEIWDCTGKPFKQKDFIGSRAGSIEALAWCNRSLFSGGQYDFILEYDSESYVIKRQTAVTGGVTWCLALSPNKNILAAGTEQGIVCLFTVTDDGLSYYKTLNRQEERIFCISWHRGSEYIVTGSIDYIHLRHIDKGQMLQFPVGKTTKQEKTIIWSVSLLSDMTIITGDSRGKTCFWSGEYGTLINDIQTHQADVLTMQVSQDETSIYVAGVDPVIVEVQLVDKGGQKGKKKMWVKSVHRRLHTHDVRAMALTKENKLFTGGVDTYLMLSYYPPKTVIKYPATPRRGYISISKRSTRPNILLGYENRVELWQLGTPDLSQKNTGRYLSIKEDRVKLAEIHLKEKETLRLCDLSPEGRGITYIVDGNVRIYEFIPPQEYQQVNLKKITVPKSEIFDVSLIHWLDEKQLLVVMESYLLKILDLNNGTTAEIVHTWTFPSLRHVNMVTSSEDKKFIVIVDSTSQVWCYNFKRNNFISFPSVKFPVTALAINNQNQLLVANSNFSFIEFDLEKHNYTPCCRHSMSSNQSDTLKSNYVIDNISFKDSGFIFLHTVSNFIVLKKHVEMNSSPIGKGNKMMKYDSVMDDSSNSSSLKTTIKNGLSFIERSNHVLYFTLNGQNNLASVELNPIKLMDSLPPALKVKKFGAM